MYNIKASDVSQLNIMVIGDIMLDHYIYGDCNRISPEAPVQIVEVKSDKYTLGGAGNVLKNLKSFNVKTSIISVIGDDENATIVIDQLATAGVSADGLVKDKDRTTTTKSRVMVSNHQLIRLDKEDTHPINEHIEREILSIIQKNIKQFNVLLLSDYNKGMLSQALMKRIFNLCREAGIKTIVDPKGNDFCKYEGVNIIKPNKKEAIVASGILIKDSESLKAACVKIKELTNCDDVVITMSEEGIALFSEEELRIIPTKVLDVIDVTGAGDTVLASLGLAIALGISLPEACIFANHAAAIVVSKVGSATATIEEIKRNFSN
jgi:rfaE bifunctional protein kinase chain/domain